MERNKKFEIYKLLVLERYSLKATRITEEENLERRCESAVDAYIKCIKTAFGWMQYFYEGDVEKQLLASGELYDHIEWNFGVDVAEKLCKNKGENQ